MFICHLMWECHHQTLILTHRLADDLIGLPVPRPTATGHLPVGCGEGGSAVGANITGFPIRHSEQTRAGPKPPVLLHTKDPLCYQWDLQSFVFVLALPLAQTSSSLGWAFTCLSGLKLVILLPSLPTPCKGTGQAPRSHPQHPSSLASWNAHPPWLCLKIFLWSTAFSPSLSSGLPR